MYDNVAEVTEEEQQLYEKIEFDLGEYCKDAGRPQAAALHQGASPHAGAKTVIPRKVIGKFSIRRVPDMDPEVVEKQVVDYMQKKFSELGSPNKMTVSMGHGAKSSAWSRT
ncbi:unnamed protein product [Arctogadus glacialis]